MVKEKSHFASFNKQILIMLLNKNLVFLIIVGHRSENAFSNYAQSWLRNAIHRIEESIWSLSLGPNFQMRLLIYYNNFVIWILYIDITSCPTSGTLIFPLRNKEKSKVSKIRGKVQEQNYFSTRTSPNKSNKVVNR